MPERLQVIDPIRHTLSQGVRPEQLFKQASGARQTLDLRWQQPTDLLPLLHTSRAHERHLAPGTCTFTLGPVPAPSHLALSLSLSLSLYLCLYLSLYLSPHTRTRLASAAATPAAQLP